MAEPCELCRTEEEKDFHREFSHWLMTGGMEALRDMQKTSNDYKRLRSIGFDVLCKMLWVGLLIVLGIIAIKLGIKELPK